MKISEEVENKIRIAWNRYNDWKHTKKTWKIALKDNYEEEVSFRDNALVGYGIAMHHYKPNGQKTQKNA